MAKDSPRRWWTRDEERKTIVLVEDGIACANVAEIPDPWSSDTSPDAG